ncbi:MAG TPA: hypothetical protein VH479_23315, partial [Acidimicrobiales bacterium]
MPDVGGAPEVVLRPRGRERSPADVLRLLLGLALLGLGLLAATVARNTVGGIEADIVEGYDRVPDRIAEVATALAFILAAAVPLLAIVVLVVRHRYRRALALLLGGYLASWVMIGLDRLLSDRGVVQRVRADTGGDVEITDPRFATASLIASVVAMVVIASPWLPRAWRRALWLGVTFLVLLRMVSSGEPAFDAALALAVGLVVGSGALVLIGTPSPEPAAGELLAMVGRLGTVARIEQRPGSEPLLYRIEMAGGQRLRLAVRTSRDRSADMLGRLWRYARLRSTEVDQPHLTVQRRVEHEALAQTMAATGGARVRTVRSVVASPGGSVGLVTEAAEGVPAATLDAEDLAGGPLVDAWRQVGCLHRAGIAHRSLGLGQFTITPDGRAVLGGFDSARVAATERDISRDTAQLLVATAVVVGAPAAVDAAVDAVGTVQVGSALPYLQPLALPGSTRRALRQHGNLLSDLRERVQVVTGEPSAALARLERVKPRTLVS